MPRTSLEELLLRPAEWLELARAPAAPRFPPTFMVGPPRAGTTVAGLHALAVLELAYVPNVSKAHKKTALVRAKRALARGSWKPDYANSYGRAEGELAPSDGWDVFQRYFEPYSEARVEQAREASGLVRAVAGFERVFGAPFFTKNNANSMRVEALAELFPGAFFVHVTRSYPEAASSLLEARHKHGVALGEWWSAAPPQHLGRSFASEIEQVALTLRGIDEYLRERLSRLAPRRSLELDYDAFCARPAQLIEWLEARYREAGVTLRRRAGTHPERFEARRLPPERRAELERALAPFLA